MEVVKLKDITNDNTLIYRYWYILDELPQGWKIDKTTGAPAPSTDFITNGKSILSGEQERALLRWRKEPEKYKEQELFNFEELNK
jgi:hypothetical protein